MALPERLVIRQELRLVDTVELRGELIKIGRTGGCEITLPHEAVSRTHASLEKREDGWHVLDRGSVNGTRLNGRRVKESRLEPGDVIEIRPYALNYLAPDPDVGDRSICLADSRVERVTTRESGDVGAVIKQRLEDLYALSRLVIERRDDGSYWRQMHEALQRCLAATRCVIVGVGEDTGVYRLAPQARPSDARMPLEVSRSVLQDVVESRRGLLIQQVSDHGEYAAAESLVSRRVGSVVCVPVVVDGKARAAVYADRLVTERPFQPGDLDFAIAAVDLAATAVSVDELQGRAKELARIRGRMDAAREIQEMLLPSPVPQPPWGEVAARNYPADQVSGDVYDVRLDSSARLLVMIGDVSGKGAPAALVAAILHNSYRQAVLDLDDMGEIVRRINESISAYQLSACYATLVLCRWSAEGDTVEIANAGHHAPLWVSASGTVEAFPDRIGLPVGITPDWTGEVVQRECREDSIMLLSSDGATEASNEAKDEFGLTRLGEALALRAQQPPDEILSDLAQEIRAFCTPKALADDLTLLAVRARR